MTAALNITTIRHHSELGTWTHSECAPAHLTGVVEKLWHFEGTLSVSRERSFPRVYSEIILQQASGLSKARFISLFRQQTGLTPKYYARVLRFQQALRLVQQGGSLTAAALAAGYFDQSHMHHDFSEFASMTPAEYLASERFPNSLSLSERD